MIHRFCLLLLLPVLLGACSSKKEEQPQVMSQRMADRFTAARKRMNDPNDRSVYDKAMQSSIGRGKNTGGWMNKKNYKASSFGGTKAYTNTKNFQTNNYARASEQSRYGSQSFAQKDKMATAGHESFKTSESRFAGQSAREGSQVFGGANDVFKTGANRAALKSQIKNDRPKFIELEENKRKSAYSEEQVRRLLGRD